MKACTDEQHQSGGIDTDHGTDSHACEHHSQLSLMQDDELHRQGEAQAALSAQLRQHAAELVGSARVPVHAMERAMQAFCCSLPRALLFARQAGCTWPQRRWGAALHLLLFFCPAVLQLDE